MIVTEANPQRLAFEDAPSDGFLRDSLESLVNLDDWVEEKNVCSNEMAEILNEILSCNSFQQQQPATKRPKLTAAVKPFSFQKLILGQSNQESASGCLQDLEDAYSHTCVLATPKKRKVPQTNELDAAPKNGDLKKIVGVGGWTHPEDALLRRAIAKFPEGTPIKWAGVSREVGSRNRIQCRQRWKMVLTESKNKGPWRLSEDQLLAEAVTQQIALAEGNNWDWNHMCSQIPGRNKIQTKDRWYNHLDPSITKGPFTAEEDAAMLSLHQQHGNKFAKIAREMPGRPLVQIKIRWRTFQRAAKRKTSAKPTPHTQMQAC